MRPTQGLCPCLTVYPVQQDLTACKEQHQLRAPPVPTVQSELKKLHSSCASRAITVQQQVLKMQLSVFIAELVFLVLQLE